MTTEKAAVAEDENDDIMTVSSLMEKLKEFPGDMPVVILARMPFDKDDEENHGKTDDELDDEHTIEVALEGVEKIEYEEEDGKTEAPVLAFYCDIHSVMEDDDDDEEVIDSGD